MGSLGRPDVGQLEGQYFTDLDKYLPQAEKVSKETQSADWNNQMALRESALPGFGAGLANAGKSLWPMLSGQFSPWMNQQFASSGGALGVGTGMGGGGYQGMIAGFGGLDRARQMQTQAYSMLPILLGAMPHLQGSSTIDFLNQGIMNPQQRTNLEMQLRQQQIGMNNTLLGLPTSSDMWAQHLNESGAMLMGGGGMGMGGGGGGGSSSGFSPSSPSSTPAYGLQGMMGPQ